MKESERKERRVVCLRKICAVVVSATIAIHLEEEILHSSQPAQLSLLFSLLSISRYLPISAPLPHPHPPPPQTPPSPPLPTIQSPLVRLPNLKYPGSKPHATLDIISGSVGAGGRNLHPYQSEIGEIERKTDGCRGQGRGKGDINSALVSLREVEVYICDF